MTVILFLVVVIFLGVKRKATADYWKLGISAVILHTGVAVLLSGRGTLEDPNGDGLITAMLRQQFNDGPEMVAVGIATMILGWVVPILMVRKALKQQACRRDCS